MRKLVLALALLLPLGAAAQSGTESAIRTSAGVSWKIRKGLHLNVEEEMRTSGVFSSLDRLHTTVSMDYKLTSFLRVGAGYTLINPYDGENRVFKNPRHRIFAEGMLHCNLDGFSFSVKERVQMTHRTGSFNVYQNTPNAVSLKSRVGVEYKNWKNFEPGLFFEVRTVLNDPWGTISGQEKTTNAGKKYYSYTPAGYTHVYNDRYRLTFRTDITMGGHHVLRPYAHVDFCSPYEIDTNADGTRVFSADYNNYLKVIVGLGYTFKF